MSLPWELISSLSLDSFLFCVPWHFRVLYLPVTLAVSVG